MVIKIIAWNLLKRNSIYNSDIVFSTGLLEQTMQF